MSGKCRPSLRPKTLYNVDRSSLSTTDKECIHSVFELADHQKSEIEKNEKIIKAANDLIETQKAENETQSQNFKVLVSDHRCLQHSFDNLKDLYESEKAKVEKANEKSIYFAKELQTAKAEIERLQTDNSSMQSTLAKMSMGVEQAKAEAIKEFAKRLKAEYKKHFSSEWIAVYNTIDNLVKEMVGDTE